MVRCAYCGAEGKMSREHVIPKGFINNMDFKALTVWLDKAPSYYAFDLSKNIELTEKFKKNLFKVLKIVD